MHKIDLWLVTNGNFTVTQSDFATPCVSFLEHGTTRGWETDCHPQQFITETNSSVNGFSSGFIVNGTSQTFSVPITAEIQNTTQVSTLKKGVNLKMTS